MNEAQLNKALEKWVWSQIVARRHDYKWLFDHMKKHGCQVGVTSVKIDLSQYFRQHLTWPENGITVDFKFTDSCPPTRPSRARGKRLAQDGSPIRVRNRDRIPTSYRRSLYIGHVNFDNWLRKVFVK